MATSPRVTVAPSVLRWAVERARWDEETIDQRAPKLGAWTAGERPTFKQVESFANATHTPFGLLFLPEPPDERVPIPDMRTIGNGVAARPSADLLETIYTCQERQDWYRDYAVEHGLVAVDFVGSASRADAPATVAERIRSELGLDAKVRASLKSWQESLRGLIDTVEEAGALVMVSSVVGSNNCRPLSPEEFRGFALSDPIAPLVFVNGADTKAAQAFTLIHEIAHLWLGHSALSDASMTVRSGNEEELWCNEVAAEVFVPTGDRPRASGGDFYNVRPLRVSRTFTRAVASSAFEGSTGYRDAYRLLGTKSHETFRRLVDEAEPALDR